MAHELAEAGRIRLVQGLDGNLGSRTLHESVYKRLREFILDGDVSPGDRLDERHLSAALGVSRTPIRDAIGRLAAEGLIDYRPHQGNYIKVLSVKEFDELYVVRAELECLAVKLASDKSSPEFLKALEETVIESERALGDNDLAAFGALSALGERGLRAGTDFALMGFDNVLDAAHSNPPLSTIDIRPRELGEQAATILLSRIENPTQAKRLYLADPRLVLRQSG